MSTSIIKEFLVALGWDVDEQGYKEFQDRIHATTKSFEEYGKVAAAAGTAIAVAITKTASEMEKLYFSSQRAGASVSNLMAVRFGAEQIGIGAENAAAMIERMASAVRSNPGMKTFFDMAGATFTSDSAKNFMNLMTRLAEMDKNGQGVMARLIGAQFGFDETTLQQIFKNMPDLIKQQKEFAELAARAGVKMDETGPQFHQFMMDVRTLWESVEILAIAFGAKLLPFAESTVHALQTAVNWMLKLNDETGGWSSAIGGIVVTLGGLAASLSVLRGLSGMFGVGAASGVAEGAAAVGGLSLGPIIAIVVAAVAAYLLLHSDTAKQAVGAVSDTVGSMIQKFEGFSGRVYRDIGGKATVGYGHVVRAGENFSGGITRAAAAALLTQDMTSARDAVMRLVKVALNSNQMGALTDFVYNLGPGALAKSTLLKKLNAGDYDGAAAQFERFNKVLVNGSYQTNSDLTRRRLGEEAMFQKPDVTLHQETNITVHGSDSASDTARTISGEQSRVHGDLIRNLAGAIQ